MFSKRSIRPARKSNITKIDANKRFTYRSFLLELHWDSIAYSSEKRAELKGAYFIGPVLQQTAKIQSNDRLTLDLSDQHQVFVPGFYHAELSWGEVIYKQSGVFLKNCFLEGKHENSIQKLSNKDFILIDCFDHQEKKHPFVLVYFAKVMKQEGEEKY